MANAAIVQHCVTCGEMGHTYMACPTLSFGDMMCAAFGVGSIMTGRTADEVRADVLRAELKIVEARLARTKES